jgi:hypothetical protein
MSEKAEYIVVGVSFHSDGARGISLGIHDAGEQARVALSPACARHVVKLLLETIAYVEAHPKGG